MPDSCLPAPVSMNFVTPPPPFSCDSAIHCTLSRQRTRPVTCSTSRRRMSTGSLTGRAVTLATTGTDGLLILAAASADSISTAAGAISGEWNGADTGRAIALTPLALAAAMAASTPAFVPDITTLPLLLSLATTTVPAAEPSSAMISAISTSTLPMRAAIAPVPAGAAACMASPRRRSSLAASVTDRAPAAASAEYSPSECPATKAACEILTPKPVSSARAAARLTAISAGWAFAVSVRVSIGPSHISFDRLSPSAASTSSNTALAAGKASASSLPMPTACEPWPGKMKAIRDMKRLWNRAVGSGFPRNWGDPAQDKWFPDCVTLDFGLFCCNEPASQREAVPGPIREHGIHRGLSALRTDCAAPR